MLTVLKLETVSLMIMLKCKTFTSSSQNYYKRINICQDQSSVELFWKKKPQKTRKYSKIDNSPFHLKTSNGPMCLANNDLWLPNMVSK